MRSGKWRGLAVVIALGAGLLAGSSTSSRADWFHKAIPRETPALDYRTGSQMMAPPIPAGHYTKDYAGAVHGAAGMAFGSIHGLKGKLHGIGGGGLCNTCGGDSCGSCGGLGHDRSGGDCGDCGGDGCGTCGSGFGNFGGLFHKGKKGRGGFGDPCGDAGCGTHGSSQIASMPAPPAKSSSQTYGDPQAMGSMQMDPVCGGCLGTGAHAQGGGCGLCGGTGRLKSLFGHGQGLGHPGMGGSNGCGSCGGKGCGACGGAGNGMGACRGCGGRGCGLCSHLGGMKGKVHGLAGKLTHKGQIKYFVGAGGPVPITPGYVPYVVTTRSPRDFLAFPPFSDQIP